MKFVCDNCSAKYQIADEKVAGKTVRMKCKRCAHEICVRADAGEQPSAGAPAVDTEGAMPISHRAESLPAAAPSGPRALAPLPPQGSPVGPSAPHAVPHPPAGAPRPVPVHAAPRPITSGPPRAVPPPPRLMGAPSAARPMARGGGGSAVAVAAAQPALEEEPHVPPPPARSTWGDSDDEATSLFSMQSMPRPADASPLPVPAAPPPPSAEGDGDWYVGIAGNPLGPVPASTIRERARAGEVDGDSLVWREGLPEWRPLKTFPELFQMVAAAQHGPYAGGYVPIVAAIMPAPAPSTPIALVTRATPAPAGVTTAGVTTAGATTAGATTAGVTTAGVTTAGAAPLAVLGDPFAPAPHGPPNGKSNGYHGAHVEALAPAPTAAPAVIPDEAPLGPPPAAPVLVSPPIASGASPVSGVGDAGAKVERELEIVLGKTTRGGGTHPTAYAFIAAAAVFGGVAAYVMLSKPQTRIVVVQQAATGATATAAAPEAPTADGAQVEVGEISAANPQGPVARQGTGALHPRASAAPTAGPSAPIDTSGFNNSVPGPAATAPSGGQAGGGGQLTQGEIGAVVSSNQPLVKRKCWQPALEARPPNGPTNARVNGSLTIGASGQVESATASGAERDFPGLSSCIAARMKGWKFPPSGGSTPVSVPFVFAGQ